MIEQLCASIDLGSNSFRLLIAKTINTPNGYQIIPILNARKQVSLASGLDEDNILDKESIQRAADAFSYFKHKIQAVNKDKVFIVATSTFRIAKNIKILIDKGEEILGVSIQTISGLEEARLIYLGTSHTAPHTDLNRLVIDIGGGSTEFILGHYHKPLLCKSANIGCIGISNMFFKNEYSENNFNQAILYIKNNTIDIVNDFKKQIWNQVIGSSGTARILAYLACELGNEEEYLLTRNGLDIIKNYLISCQSLDNVKLKKINQQRIVILPGGLSIMIAIFEELNIQTMYIQEGGLRFGILYENLDSIEHNDVRDISIDSLQSRFYMNILPIEQLLIVGDYFATELGLNKTEVKFLNWALKLHQIGSYISADAIHKHSAYIIQNSILPGFYSQEQIMLCNLVLGQKGSLNKLSADFIIQNKDIIMCLRLSIILLKNSLLYQYKNFKISTSKNGYTINTLPNLSNILYEEEKYWKKVNIEYNLI